MIAGAVEEGDEIANNQGESDRGLKRIDTDERFWVGRAIKQRLISQLALLERSARGQEGIPQGLKPRSLADMRETQG
jgi:hypothetical protein